MKGFLKVAKDSVKEFLGDNCMNIAAAIAYYTLQAIFPLILTFIVIASFVLQEGETRQNFINSVKSAIPNGDVGAVIDNVSKSAPGLLSVGAIFLIWSGSGIFDQLVFGTNVAYDVEKDTRSFFKKLFLRFFLLLIVGGLIAASLVVTILFQLLINANVELFGIKPSNFSFILPIVSYLIPILIMFCVFAILYKLGPDRKGNGWKGVAIGAAVAAVLFELLKYGFAFYVTFFNAADSSAKTYGVFSTVLLFLLYLWLSACVMLFGAEVASVLNGFKSVLEGPGAQQDPGTVNEAERIDSEGGPEVTPREKAQGKDQPIPASIAEGKESPQGYPLPRATAAAQAAQAGYKEGREQADKRDANKAPQPLPAYAASTSRYPAQPDRQNPVTVVIGAIVLGIAALIGLIFRRKDPAA